MEKKITRVEGIVEICEIPYEVNVPVFIKKEIPDYILVKEEIVYKVPKIEYENKTYEKPILIGKEYIIPKYVEKIYEIPKYITKEYEIPKFVEKIIEIPVIKHIQREEINVITKDVHVTNAIIENKTVTNAEIKHVIVEALHPKYLCANCRKETVQ